MKKSLLIVPVLGLGLTMLAGCSLTVNPANELTGDVEVITGDVEVTTGDVEVITGDVEVTTGNVEESPIIEVIEAPLDEAVE